MYSIECHNCTALNVTFKIEMEDHVRSGFEMMKANVQLRTVIQSNAEVRTKMISQFMTCRMPSVTIIIEMHVFDSMSYLNASFHKSIG